MLANQDRARQGLGPLRLDPTLSAAAQRHAEDMLRRKYFAHESPEGASVRDRFLAAGGTPYVSVGENLATCSRCANAGRALLEQFERGWMASPGHRENLLSPGFERFGFAMATGRDGRVYAVQTFAGPGSPLGRTRGHAVPLAADASATAAVAALNAVRQEAGIALLVADPALSAAAQALATRGGRVAGLGAVSSAALVDALPARSRDRWRTLTLIGGECGGCGTDPTTADLAFFRDSWLQKPDYRSVMLDPSTTHMGFAIAADGAGRKLALAVLAQRH